MMHLCFLISSLLITLTAATYGEKSSSYGPEKMRAGVITIRQAKVSEFPISPRVRKTVVKVSSSAPTVVTKSRGTPVQNIVKTPTKSSYTNYQYSPVQYSHSPMLGYHHPPQYTTTYQQPILTYQSAPIVYQTSIKNQESYSQPQQQNPQIYAYLATFPEQEKPSKSAPTPIKSQYSFKPPVTSVDLTNFQPSPLVSQPQPATYTKSSKKIVAKVRKIPVTKVLNPTVIYHTSYTPESYAAPLQQQPTLQQVQTLPQQQHHQQYTYVQQPEVHTTSAVTASPYANYYYAQPQTAYTVQNYGASPYSSGSGLVAASSKLKPSGLGISYSEVGPGIASYNFQGFGVQYGY